MEEELLRLPKVDLHLHLDGSVRLETAYELLQGKLSYEEISKQMVIDEDCHSLTDYLIKFDLPISLMQSKENLSRIAFELTEDLAKENVIYAEIRFAPFLHLKNGLTLDEVITAVLDGLAKGPIKTGLILCCMRGFSLEENKKIVLLTEQYRSQGVVGFDLAGDETKYPTHLYQELFVLGQKLNLNYTIHAGEGSGLSSVKEALSFHPARLGHGINSNGVYDQLKKEKVTLEICPTSNIHTKVVSSLKDHPINNLYHNGILVTINTDNRTVSKTTLTKEYLLLARTFDFTKEDFKQFNINSINASFLEESEKEKYLIKIKDNNS